MVENDQAWVYIGGIKRRFVEVESAPDVLGFATASSEKGRSAGEVWAASTSGADRTGWTGGMGAIYTDYDENLVREFLELKGLSESPIEMFGLLNDQEALMNSSFLELSREEAGNYSADTCQIIGEMVASLIHSSPNLRSTFVTEHV